MLSTTDSKNNARAPKQLTELLAASRAPAPTDPAAAQNGQHQKPLHSKVAEVGREYLTPNDILWPESSDPLDPGRDPVAGREESEFARVSFHSAL